MQSNQISEDDFYAKNKEFQLWLKTNKEIYLDEINGKEQRKYFKKFVSKWNKGKLPKGLYDIDAAGIEVRASERTRFKWNIKVDKREIDEAFDTVDSLTHSKTNQFTHFQQIPESISSSTTNPNTAPLGKRKEYDQFELEEAKEKDERRLKAQRKDSKKRKMEDEEELVPKATGREAQLEKKSQVREKMRSFQDKKDNEDVEVSEDFLMGSGSSFERAKLDQQKRSNKYSERKEAENAQKKALMGDKLKAYRDKEKNTMDMLRSLIKK